MIEENCVAYIQYNCDNHITESAYEEMKKNNTSVDNVQKLVKQAFKMQSNSASRKKELKKLAEEYSQEYTKLQNVLDIKFATHNLKACKATLKGYEVVLKLAQRLKDDTTVKIKPRIKFMAIHPPVYFLLYLVLQDKFCHKSIQLIILLSFWLPLQIFYAYSSSFV